MIILIINEKMLISTGCEIQHKAPAEEGIHNMGMGLVFTHEQCAGMCE